MNLGFWWWWMIHQHKSTIGTFCWYRGESLKSLNLCELSLKGTSVSKLYKSIICLPTGGLPGVTNNLWKSYFKSDQN